MCKIKVIDSIMGSGKTSWAIQNITIFNRGDKFLYVTPYLDEVDRVVEACKKVCIPVSTPTNSKGSKSEHLKQLMKQGKNIVTTHALFDRIDDECLDVIRSQGYTLYMDEVHEVVKRHMMSEDDLNLLIESKYIEIDEKGKVSWVADDYTGKFEEFRNLCNLGSMYKYSSYVYIWCFPVSIFEAMNNIYILTYYFEGQIQSYYYKLHDMKYKMMEVYKEEGSSVYYIQEYDIIRTHRDIKHMLGLINIYEGNLNYTDGITLSSSWFDKADKDILKMVSNNTLNYFQNIVKGKSEDNMWTTLKSHKQSLKGKGYTKGFVEINARATNKYKHKKNLAYVYNRFLNPIEKNFFISHGIVVNEELYALSELLQWVFRSQIREGEPINLYLPSKRMREKVFGLWVSVIEISSKENK
ncbi:MAG: hypothetical protein ACRDBY_00970 [Cetobacterium sp.]